MIRIGKATVGAVATALVLGVCGVASAQQGQQPTEKTTQGAQQPSSNKVTSQEQFDREKVTLKDRVQTSISEADQNIDALKKLSSNEKGADKTRDEDAQKKLSMLRDHLQKDLGKIDKSTINDWSGVRPVVDRDLTAINGELDRVAAITKVPRVGAASRQPAAPTEKQPSNQPSQGQPANPPPAQQNQTPQNKQP